MITIKNNKLEILASGGDDGSVVSGVINTRITCIVYVDYIKGDEDDLKITFDSLFEPLGEYYPIMYEDSPETVAPITKKLSSSGKYRLIITVAENEKSIQINAQFENISSNPGTAEIVIVPATPTIG